MIVSGSVLLLKFKFKCMLYWNVKRKYNTKLNDQCKGNLRLKFKSKLKFKLQCSGSYLHSEYSLRVHGVGSVRTYERTEGLSCSAG
jgi:hypothetical protein